MTPDVSLNQLWARALVEELVRGGVRHAVICPGSRSAPLALACAAEEALRTWSVIDERSAGFFALGIAKASGLPSLVVATSGTAGAHFYPAVIEAAASQVPLVVLLADRPIELQGWGAPQTIRQPGLYGDFARWSIDVGVPEATSEALLHLRATAARAVAVARRAPAGAVQVNVPLREPLAPIADGAPLAALDPRAVAGRVGAPLTRLVAVERAPDRAAIGELRDRMRATPRGAILCGPRDADDGLRDAALALGRAFGYPVLAEAASQVRFGDGGAPIALYDALLRHAPFARAHRPELVVRLGGGWTAKGPQAWIDRSGAFVAQISDGGALHDPAHAAALVIEGDAVRACRALADGATARASEFTAGFEAAERRARTALAAAFAESDRLDEPRIAHETARALPAGAQLFVSSSMPIRDVDAFAWEGAAIRVLASRGVNGIDGILSTALGVAVGGGRPTVLLTGDVALLHDLGGLVTARRAGLALTIVVVDNDGGGIFSFLPIARHPEHERLFGTPHGIPLAHAAALAGARHTVADGAASLRAAIVAGVDGGGLHLIEVRSTRDGNVPAHERLFARVAEALGDGPWA